MCESPFPIPAQQEDTRHSRVLTNISAPDGNLFRADASTKRFAMSFFGRREQRRHSKRQRGSELHRITPPRPLVFCQRSWTSPIPICMEFSWAVWEGSCSAPLVRAAPQTFFMDVEKRPLPGGVVSSLSGGTQGLGYPPRGDFFFKSRSEGANDRKDGHAAPPLLLVAPLLSQSLNRNP